MPDLTPFISYCSCIFFSCCAISVHAIDLAVLKGLSQDIEPPVIVQQAQDQNTSCDQDYEFEFDIWYGLAGGADATDNSNTFHFVGILDLATAKMELELSNQSLCGENRTIRIGFVAVDTCGNQSIDTTFARFNVLDDIEPTLTQAATSVSLPCTSITQDSLNRWLDNHGGAEAIDDCSEEIRWEYVWQNILNNTSGQGVSGQGPYIEIDRSRCSWSINVAFLGYDACDGRVVSNATFKIEDTEPPVLSSMPRDTTVLCDQIPPNDVTAIDGCDGALAVEFFETNNQDGDLLSCENVQYFILREWITFDICGNNVFHQQRITVIDTIRPTFTLPDNVQVNCTLIDDLSSTGNVIDVFDNCQEPIISYQDSIVSEDCPFLVHRTWIVTDYCGNSSTGIQSIEVIDDQLPEVLSPAVNKRITCDTILNVEEDFLQWVSRAGDAEVVDQCATLKWFAAEPGSYDILDPSTYPGRSVGVLDTAVCPSEIKSFLRNETVDFVYYDLCGNAIMTQASYAIIDTLAPTIVDCPMDITVQTDTGLCTMIYTPPQITIEDNCVQNNTNQSQTLSKVFSSDTPGTSESIVDSLFFEFGSIGLLNNQSDDQFSISIRLNNMDLDDPTEFFYIKAEDGTILAKTDNINIQCGRLEFVIDDISLEQHNLWAQDGLITIWIVPNRDTTISDFSVNDVCGVSTAIVTLNYALDTSRKLLYEIQVDGAASIEVDENSTILLDTGVHTLIYIASDCAGNMTQCEQEVTVLDVEEPELSCPENLTIYASDEACEVLFDLPLSVRFMDNCAGSIVYDQTIPPNGASSYFSFSTNMDNELPLATNTLFTFSDVAPIMYNADLPTLQIVHSGDIDDVGEHFDIISENGTSLGITNIRDSEDCSATVETMVTIPIEIFNLISADGTIEIALVSNIDATVEGGGINACGPLDSENAEDGISSASIRLMYSDERINYYIDGATQIDESILDTIAVSLNVGMNEVYYFAQDASGNTDTCSFLVSVLDTISPVIECQSAVIFIDPSGLETYTLDVSELTTIISDNCEISNIDISPSEFDCSALDQEFSVTVTVTDLVGNTSSCSSRVKVDIPILNPTFSSGLCENDTLSLFANVPPAAIPNTYSFSWTGPNMFVSNLENPFILNADASYSGTYVLEVEGFGSCISTGTVEVSVDQLNTPEISSTSPEACQGDDVLLTTNSFSGNISYLWYEGIFPNGILINTTESGSLVVNPTLGEHFYYVQVESQGCITNASPSYEVVILDPPLAVVNDPFITICEGEDIVLGTDDFNPLYEYFWSGPNDYSENGQFPTVVSNADISNQGSYSLVIKFGNCLSDTANSQVVLFDKPVTPIITGEEVYCEGSTIILSVNNVANADQYDWLLNGSLFTVSNTNSLVVNAAQASMTGDWTVLIDEGVCKSDTSAIKEISVESQFQISANNSGPSCQGDSVQLNVAFIPNASYEWITPDGNVLTERNPKVPAIVGEYTVNMTTASGCTSTSSTIVELLSIPIITALSNDAVDCTDGSSLVRFEPTIVPTGNYTYQWSGPMDLEAIANPTIVNADTLANGIYTLTVFNGSCESESRSTEINFNAIPEQAIFDQYSYTVCEGDQLLLETSNSFPSDYEYAWETPKGSFITVQNSLTIPLTDQNDAGFYILNAVNEDCFSVDSDTVFVHIQALPVQAIINSSAVSCEGSSYIFTSSAIDADAYFWTGPNGWESNEANPVIPSIVNNIHGGSYQLVIAKSGCPSIVSEVFDLTILAVPDAPIIEAMQYELCLSQTSSIEICITEESILADASYELYLDDDFVLSTLDRCFTLSNDDPFIRAGILDLDIVIRTGVCRSNASESVMLTVSETPNQNVVIDDATLNFCDLDIVELDIMDGNMEGLTWRWDAKDGDIVFQSPTSASTTATGMRIGANEIYIYSTFGACEDYAIDTAFVNIVPGAVVENDTFNLDYNQNAFLDIVENDDPNGPFILNILQQPEFGNINIINNLLQYVADPNFSNSQTFAYELCNINCVNNCEVAFVTIVVNQNFDCVAPSIITPNGDGYNDFFVVPCFNTGEYQNNEVKIFNEWGDEVFGAKPYENDWGGTYQGQALPVGTYFYIVDIGDDTQPLNGFLMIQR